ncbi:MAG: hypothetical protein U5K69_26925 [Balneolaceae bacterium]|nr:hypothetical protein [Balneolaceae bacterium]
MVSGAYLVENGRIKDDGALTAEDSAPKNCRKSTKPGVRLTPNHNVLLTDIKEVDKEAITDILHNHGVLLDDEIANVIKYSMACPALPTCGLAITESERALPDIIRELDGVLQELGLENEKLSVRMTGCPNGCSRPYVADIGFVGRSLDKYTIFIGGNAAGTRLNKEYKDLVSREDLVNEVRPLLEQFKENRRSSEGFSDYWNRVGLEETEDIPA